MDGKKQKTPFGEITLDRFVQAIFICCIVYVLHRLQETSNTETDKETPKQVTDLH